MELQTTILALKTEHGIISDLIRAFENLERLRRNRPDGAPPAGKRRGRKFMNAEERQEVSERMKRYWAGRRKQGKRPTDA